MYTVAAVCTGNICRSPMAEFLLREALAEAGLGKDTRVESFAVSTWEEGNPMDSRARAWLLAHQPSTSEPNTSEPSTSEPSTSEAIGAHVSRPLGLEELQRFNLILALDVEHLEHLDAMARELPEDPANTPVIRLLGSFNPELADASPADQGIYDPWYGGPSDFEAVGDLITACLPGVVEFIRRESAARDMLDTA